MITASKRISSLYVLTIYFIVNMPLVAISIYTHALLIGITKHGDLFEEIGLWILIAFKIIGANLILKQIMDDYKID